MPQEFGVTCLHKISELAKPVNRSTFKNQKYRLCSFRAIFSSYFSKAALNTHSQFKTSCLPVASLIWACLELSSDIHLFASISYLLKAQVRKNAPARNTYMFSFCKSQCYSHCGGAETPKEFAWRQWIWKKAQERKKLTFVWKTYCLSKVEVPSRRAFLQNLCTCSRQRERVLFG